MEVVKTINFMHARGLIHPQFDNILNDEGVSHGLPYHTEVRWLSWDIVLKRILELRYEIVDFNKIKWKPVVQ